MKTKLLFLLSFLTLITFLYSCQEKKQVKEQMESKTTICYRAIDGQDTAWLRIDTASSQVIGLLTFNYAKGRDYDGEFKGKFYGDTLKGHFDFKVNQVDKWYRNPVAFLKRNGQLTMGVGNFNMVWGSSIFDPKVPIDYDRGRFVFEGSDCQ